MNPAIPTTRRQLSTPPAPASPFPYHPGSLLSVLDLTVDGVSQLLIRATELENEDPIVRDRILAKRRIALLFYESSTRTRTSFELACKGAGRRHHAGLEPELEHREGRIAEGHRPDAARAGRRSHHPAPQLVGRGVAAGRVDTPAGDQRRRRHARASHAGAARPAHDPGASAAGTRRGCGQTRSPA